MSKKFQAKAAATIGKTLPFWLYASLSSFIFLADQASKFWAVLTLTSAGLGAEVSWSQSLQRFWQEVHPKPVRGVEIIADHWHYHYVENPGSAWGFLAQTDSVWRTPFFLIVSTVAMVFLILYFRQTPPTQRLLRVALAMVFGGAVGNFFDRIRLGYVIDFIDWHWYRIFTWPTFNVADAAISIGVGLLFVDMLFTPPQHAASNSVDKSAVGGQMGR